MTPILHTTGVYMKGFAEARKRGEEAIAAENERLKLLSEVEELIRSNGGDPGSVTDPSVKILPYDFNVDMGRHGWPIEDNDRRDDSSSSEQAWMEEISISFFGESNSDILEVLIKVMGEPVDAQDHHGSATSYTFLLRPTVSVILVI
jgi:hypothetical protein